jgi:hypothetical protein
MKKYGKVLTGLGGVAVVVTKHRQDESRRTVISGLVEGQETAVGDEGTYPRMAEKLLLRPPGSRPYVWRKVPDVAALPLPDYVVG